MQSYNVDVSMHVTFTTVITVRALSEDDARAQAETMGEEDFGYALDGTELDWEQSSLACTIGEVEVADADG